MLRDGSSRPAAELSRAAGVGAHELAHARLCYDHLAGRLGIALMEILIENRWVDPELVDVTTRSVAHFSDQGIDVAELRSARRRVVRSCSEWTEQKPYIAGSLGGALVFVFIARRWVIRRPLGRGLDLTRAGNKTLNEN